MKRILPPGGTPPILPWKDGAITAADISDATAAGRSLLTAADAAAQRSLLGVDFEELDDAVLTAATSYTCPAWTPARYRRIAIHFWGKVSAGTPATGYIWARLNNDTGANYEFIADNVNTAASVQGGLLGTVTFLPIAFFNNSQLSNLSLWCDLDIEKHGFSRVGRSHSVAMWNGITLAGCQKWDGGLLWSDVASDLTSFTLGIETDSTLTGRIQTIGYL